MKTCICCHELKPLDEFYAHPQMADGHLNKCKSCVKAYSRGRNPLPQVQEYQRKKGRGEKHRERTKRYAADPKNRPKTQAAKDRYIAREKVKHKAHTIVRNAIKSGRLKRGPCEISGCERKAQAHHDDYSKPLEVRWLCSRHHADHHNAEREKERKISGGLQIKTCVAYTGSGHPQANEIALGMLPKEQTDCDRPLLPGRDMKEDGNPDLQPA